MSAFSGEDLSLFRSTINNDQAVAEPSINNLVGSMVDLFRIFGDTQKEMIEPQKREQIVAPRQGLVVTPENYSELALAEIARQNVEFGKISNAKEVAILTAFQQAAGLKAGVQQSQLDLTTRAVDNFTVTGSINGFIKSANDFGASTVGVAKDVVQVGVEGIQDVAETFKFVTSPLGLILVAGTIIAGAIIFVKV